MRHNNFQDKKKFSCVILLTLLIVAGCSTARKTDSLSQLQRQRIQNLERTVAQQEKTIAQLKAKSWVAEPVVPHEKIAFKKLRMLVAEKKWGAALKESSRLKPLYPRSVSLHTFRYKIFRRIGLEAQAQQERDALRQILAGQPQKSDVF